MIGLKRIGIILSVLWVVIGGFWTRSMLFDSLGKSAKLQFETCLENEDRNGKSKDCSAEFDANWQRDVTNVINMNNAFDTFVPLLLAWVLFYIIARLTRWVAAGFRQDAERNNAGS
jgi:hypothetical protein